MLLDLLLKPLRFRLQCLLFGGKLIPLRELGHSPFLRVLGALADGLLLFLDGIELDLEVNEGELLVLDLLGERFLVRLTGTAGFLIAAANCVRVSCGGLVRLSKPLGQSFGDLLG